MAKDTTIHCSVVTPERPVLDCEARFAAFPAHDGEIGVLPNRAPLVCKLGIGALRIEGTDAEHVLYIEGGFAHVLDNRLTVLTDQARRVEEFSAADTKQSLEDALAIKIPDDAAYLARNNAVERARVQKRLIESANR